MKRTCLFSRIYRHGLAATSAALLLALVSCAHETTLGRLISCDRDEHGCLSTAGYTWSYALHDCVRLWEVGEFLEGTRGSAFVIFGKDSVYAEVFFPDGKHAICRRTRGKDLWKSGKKKVRVSLKNGVITVYSPEVTLTKSP